MNAYLSRPSAAVATHLLTASTPLGLPLARRTGLLRPPPRTLRPPTHPTLTGTAPHPMTRSTAREAAGRRQGALGASGRGFGAQTRQGKGSRCL